MSRSASKFFLMALCLLLTCACKKETGTDPDPYVYSADLQSSKDISYATHAVTDLEMILGFMGDGQFPTFYTKKNPPASLDTVIYDALGKRLAALYDRAACVDGKTRDGSVLFYYTFIPPANPNLLLDPYYRNFGYSAQFTFKSYIVDGWKIELFDKNQFATVLNKLSAGTTNPFQTNLSWELNGKFKFTNLSDTNRVVIWDGKLIKTLINTNDTNVCNPKYVINWNRAKVNYTGSVSGTINNLPFTYKIDDSNPVTRDFSCSFVPAGTSGVTEFHPFTQGAASFIISNYHPRNIDHGPAQGCDNSGTVSFNGQSFNVNFD